MTLPTVLSATAFLVAVAAVVKARRTARRLERLTESYWELRYECGQLRSRLDRFEPVEPAGQPAAPKRAGATQSFVPLSSLKPRP